MYKINCTTLLDLFKSNEMMLRAYLFFSSGHFGCVYQGIVKSDKSEADMQVAVKTLKAFRGEMKAGNGNNAILTSNIDIIYL